MMRESIDQLFVAPIMVARGGFLDSIWMGEGGADRFWELTLASASGRFLRRQTELEHFSPLLRRKPLHALRERRRYVELNYSCHKSVLLVVCYLANHNVAHPFQCPCHSHPHSQRTESINLSFFRSALHTAHDLIHMFLLLYFCTQIGLASRGLRCSAVVI